MGSLKKLNKRNVLELPKEKVDQCEDFLSQSSRLFASATFIDCLLVVIFNFESSNVF